MRDEARVLAVASDAGSARVLIPVARTMLTRGVGVRAAVSGPAEGIVRAELPEVDSVPVRDETAGAVVEELITRDRFDVIVTGAGSYNVLEHAARLAARAVGIPSVAVLDYWFEYHARFHRGCDGIDVESWPDLVCALDDITRQGVIAAGCPPDRIVVTGAPNLEASQLWWRTDGHTSRRALAEKFNVTPDRVVLAFFSEPYFAKPDGRLMDGAGGLYDSAGNPRFGYTAVQMLTCVVDALERATLPGHTGPQVIVKAHPLEWARPLHDFAASRQSSPVSVVVVEDANPKELVALADAVVGMSSVTLLEAALVGKTAVSVQIGLTDAAPFDPCIGNALGMTVPVRDEHELDTEMTAIITGRTPRAGHTIGLQVDGAAARVVDAVLRQATFYRRTTA